LKPEGKQFALIGVIEPAIALAGIGLIGMIDG
jgi:hypothetical protein